jgi:pimeloyl-ACP methyl ester carboxylesterase
MKKIISITFLLIWVSLFSRCARLESFLFQPEKADAQANLMENAKDIPSTLIRELTDQIRSESGDIAVSAYLLSHNASDGTEVKRHSHAILYCHGQTGNIGRYAIRVQELWKLGFNVLVFDYQGYGKTDGSPSEKNVLSDCRAARSFLEGRGELGINADRVALYGWSLGTAICGQIAAEKSPKALILEAPLTSVDDIPKESADLNLPGAWFLDSRMDLLSKIHQFTGSLFVMHGTNDTTLPYDFGRRISEEAKAASPNQLWKVEGAGHLTVPCVEKGDVDRKIYDCPGGFSDEYKNKVSAVLDTAFGL